MNHHSKQESPQTAVPDAGIHLEVAHLGKSFHADGRTTIVLEDIHFSVKRGEFLCITGRSGCGKTTLLNLVAGFLHPDSGAVSLHGRRVTKPGPDRCVVFQQDALFPWLTVGENIAFGLKAAGKDRGTVEVKVERFLDLVGLKDFRNYLPREISGGMKQRVSLARVLVLEPQVLLMDEPFASLDARTRAEMQDLLTSLWGQTGCTILFVTHDIEEAVVLAERVLVLDTCPSGIRRDISIPLERPRDRDGPEFVLLKRQLKEAVY